MIRKTDLRKAADAKLLFVDRAVLVAAYTELWVDEV